MYELVHVGAVRKFPLAVHPFDPIRSKIFFSRSTLSVRKFSSSVQPFNLIRSKIFFIRSAIRPHPFENFLHPFSRSTSSIRKFSASVQPFALSVSNGLPTRFSSVRLPWVRPFERIPLGTFSRERSHILFLFYLKSGVCCFCPIEKSTEFS